MVFYVCRTNLLNITAFCFGVMMIRNRVKTGGSILLIPIEDIRPAEYSSRRVVSLDELHKLADSISSVGILNPLTVMSDEDGCYRVISGERRRRAAIIAGCTSLPCILMSADDCNCMLYNIAENMHRKELHYLEIATIIDELHGIYTISELAESLSVSEGVILSRKRLLALNDNVKWKIISGSINEATANAIAGIDDSGRQNDIVDLIISTGCSFREAYEMTEKSPKKSIFAAHYRDFRIFENTIEHAVDTMQASGIRAECTKTADDSRIVYSVIIDKLI